MYRSKSVSSQSAMQTLVILRPSQSRLERFAWQQKQYYMIRRKGTLGCDSQNGGNDYVAQVSAHHSLPASREPYRPLRRS